jgi:hypothetical protein
MTSKRLYVVNSSTLVDTADVKRMVAAVNTQLRDHFAPAWGQTRVVVEYHSGTFDDVQKTVPAGSQVFNLLDTADQAGVLGWHSVDDEGRVFGNYFAKPSLDAGSTALTGPYAISSVLSHEACETEGDPACTGYATTGKGILVAQEVCDPVEGDGYEIDGVQVSNFVLPSWFNPHMHTGPFDHLGKLTAPFAMDKGGYWVQMPAGTETEKFNETVTWMKDVGFDVREGGTVVFSPEMPEWKRAAKLIRGRNLIKRSLSSPQT